MCHLRELGGIAVHQRQQQLRQDGVARGVRRDVREHHQERPVNARNLLRTDPGITGNGGSLANSQPQPHPSSAGMLSHAGRRAAGLTDDAAHALPRDALRARGEQPHAEAASGGLVRASSR